MSFMSIKAWSCSVLLSILGITVASSAVVADTEPYRSKQTDKNTMILAQTIYEQARQELPEDWYAVYRIIDRIARANQLDERP